MSPMPNGGRSLVTIGEFEKAEEERRRAWEMLNAVGEVLMEDDLTAEYDPMSLPSLVANRLASLRTDRDRLQRQIDRMQPSVDKHQRMNRHLTEQNDRLCEAIRGLRRGSCWCEMGIGNPMVKTHSPACVAAAKLAHARDSNVDSPSGSERAS